MALEQESLGGAVARGDSTLRFTATAGEENGPYQFDRYALVRGAERLVAVGMNVLGKTITVRFPDQLQDSDTVQVPA